MTYGRILATLALSTALAFPPVAVAKAAGDEDGSGLALRGVERSVPCSPEPSRVAATDEDAQPNRLVGEVIAIDQAAGVAMLSTERGVVAVHGTPEMMAQIGIGDLVVVETADEGQGDGAASPSEPGEGAASPMDQRSVPASPGERCL